MTEPNATAPGDREAGRKPYRKPEILSRERLEVLAVVCSPPSKADTIACPSGLITS